MKVSYLFLLSVAMLGVTLGCDSANAPAKKADVDVKVGGGEGVKVDVDSRPGILPEKKADVDVDVGGVKVDVDSK